MDAEMVFKWCAIPKRLFLLCMAPFENSSNSAYLCIGQPLTIHGKFNEANLINTPCRLFLTFKNYPHVIIFTTEFGILAY